MKTIIIWGCIILLMCGVIAIPCMEQSWHAEHDTNTFGPKYFPIEVITITDSTINSYGKDALN